MPPLSPALVRPPRPGHSAVRGRTRPESYAATTASARAPLWALAAAIGSVLVGFVASSLVPEADAVSSVLMLLAFGGVLTHRPERVLAPA